MAIRYFGKTDVGSVRENNQDSFFAGPMDCGGEEVFAAVVCDGMGGANGGSVASRLAVDVFIRTLTEKFKELLRSSFDLSVKDCARMPDAFLADAVKQANRTVYRKSLQDAALRGMGTTLVGLVIFRGMVYAANVGDSRLYVLTDDGICRLTHDHSYVQTLIDQGKITEAEAREHPNKNVIMRAVGTDSEVEPDFYRILPDRKCFLLCSDGLSNFVDANEMEQIVRSSASLKEAADTLIQRANAAGGGDNITAVLVKA